MTQQNLKKHRRYGPLVRLITRDGCAVVEKTYREALPPVRLMGLLLIAWERFIYSRLAGIEGIPEPMPSPDRLTLITRFMGGTNLKDICQAPDESYFEALEKLISAIHQRGVIHLDLRNRRNYGIDDRGRPYLVDFASCLYIPWNIRARRVLEAVDWMGFAKVKHKLVPRLLDAREKRLLSLGRRLSSWWIPTQALRIIRKLVKKPGAHP